MLLRQPRSNLRPCAHTIYMSVIGLRYRSALLMDVVALEPREEGGGVKRWKGHWAAKLTCVVVGVDVWPRWLPR